MTVFTALLVSLLQAVAPPKCSWGPATQSGELPAVINEASGMAISRRIPNRVYSVNDSGDVGRFFVTNLMGGDVKIVSVAGFAPLDAEDMAIGPCGDSTDCVFIADTGDNNRKRANVELVVVKEVPEFAATAQPSFRVRMQYPNGPHDSEAVSVHPDGTVYIITKGTTGSEIFKLRAERWRKPTGIVETLEPVATFDLRRLASAAGDRNGGLLATSMDIAPDGKRFLLLTYREAFEFYFDLSGPIPDPAMWRDGREYRRIHITELAQQEAIAYLPDGQSFLYDTEHNPLAPITRIMRVDCR